MSSQPRTGIGNALFFAFAVVLFVICFAVGWWWHAVELERGEPIIGRPPWMEPRNAPPESR